MLSPDIAKSRKVLTDAFNEVLNLDGSALAVTNTQIGVLKPDPDWLADVRTKTAMLAGAGRAWSADKPDLWSAVLVQFVTYADSFGAVAEAQQRGEITTRQQWIDVLQNVLLRDLKTAVAASDSAAKKIKKHADDFQVISPLLRQSIQDGWNELAKEEAEMVAISAALTHLVDLCATLEGSISEKEISSNQSIAITTVKTIYNVMIGEVVATSFLSVAGAAYTVGEFFYDIITKTAEVETILGQIADAQVKASAAAQAAAGTKLVLQVLYDMLESFARINDSMPALVAVWEDQQNRMQGTIDALKAGADPEALENLETVPFANRIWQTLKTFVIRIRDKRSEIGRPVILDPQFPQKLRAPIPA